MFPSTQSGYFLIMVSNPPVAKIYTHTVNHITKYKNQVNNLDLPSDFCCHWLHFTGLSCFSSLDKYLYKDHFLLL